MRHDTGFIAALLRRLVVLFAFVLAAYFVGELIDSAALFHVLLVIGLGIAVLLTVIDVIRGA